MTTWTELRARGNNYFNALVEPGAPWPERTQLSCWWCKHCFEAVPVTMPVRRSCHGCWHTEGIFCSWSCVLAFATSRESTVEGVGKPLIRAFATDVFRYDLREPLLKAPHWRALEAFGGPLSIERFRQSASLQMHVHVQTAGLRAAPLLLSVAHLPSEEAARQKQLRTELHALELDREGVRARPSVLKKRQRETSPRPRIDRWKYRKVTAGEPSETKRVFQERRKVKTLDGFIFKPKTD